MSQCARARAISQTSGHRYAAATLETIHADSAAMDPTCAPKLRCSKCWRKKTSAPTFYDFEAVVNLPDARRLSVTSTEVPVGVGEDRNTKPRAPDHGGD